MDEREIEKTKKERWSERERASDRICVSENAIEG